MRGTNQNMEKLTTPAGEEVETVDTAEGISTRIISISNLRDLNSVGKLPEPQPRSATVVRMLKEEEHHSFRTSLNTHT